MGLIELVDYEMRNLQDKSAQRRKDQAADEKKKKEKDPKVNEVKSKSEKEIESNIDNLDLDDQLQPGDQRSDGIEVASSSWKKDAEKKFKH